MTTQPFFFSPKYLIQLAKANQQRYAQALPFPHIVIDNFLPTEVLDAVLNEFPQPEQINWTKYEDTAQVKLASTTETQLGIATRLLLHQFNSSVFLNFLETLTGIDGIIPDPHFAGGGLHQIVRGGFLKVHVDFNRHFKLRLDRRLNLLLYLNQNWEESYGGQLELWDRDMTACQTSILPVFNRCVIFNTTDFSFHGHPNPLTCPPGWTRKSIAIYYYSNGRSIEEVNTEVSNLPHTTLFRDRPNEKQTLLPKISIKNAIRKFIPPILIDLKEYIRRQLFQS